MIKKDILTFRETTIPITAPVTKFGGQPVWLEQPCWPLSREYGTPMMFVCQIALDPDLFGPMSAQLAYLFMTDKDIAMTWDPDEGENALILQPGGIWTGPTQPLLTGPSLYRHPSAHDLEKIPCELAVQLQRGEDPAESVWEEMLHSGEDKAFATYHAALGEDKIGGTPVPTPNGGPSWKLGAGNWRLLMQLQTNGLWDGDPFAINFASDGVGYAFLAEDGRSGKFLWLR